MPCNCGQFGFHLRLSIQERNWSAASPHCMDRAAKARGGHRAHFGQALKCISYTGWKTQPEDHPWGCSRSWTACTTQPWALGPPLHTWGSFSSVGVSLVGWGWDGANKAWREWFPACCGAVSLLQVYSPQLTHTSQLLPHPVAPCASCERVQSQCICSGPNFGIDPGLDPAALPHPHFLSYCQSPCSILLDPELRCHIL